MKNVVVFGGETGLSHLLSELKLFPINVTEIIGVADNSSSTGILKRKLSISALSDIRNIMFVALFEQKDQVKIDKKEIEKLDCKLISDKLYHFSYLMNEV